VQGQKSTPSLMIKLFLFSHVLSRFFSSCALLQRATVQWPMAWWSLRGKMPYEAMTRILPYHFFEDDLIHNFILLLSFYFEWDASFGCCPDKIFCFAASFRHPRQAARVPVLLVVGGKEWGPWWCLSWTSMDAARCAWQFGAQGAILIHVSLPMSIKEFKLRI